MDYSENMQRNHSRRLQKAPELRNKNLEGSRTHLAEVDPEGGGHPSLIVLVWGRSAPLAPNGSSFQNVLPPHMMINLNHKLRSVWSYDAHHLLRYTYADPLTPGQTTIHSIRSKWLYNPLIGLYLLKLCVMQVIMLWGLFWANKGQETSCHCLC
jgi:hypothetical protein